MFHFDLPLPDIYDPLLGIDLKKNKSNENLRKHI